MTNPTIKPDTTPLKRVAPPVTEDRVIATGIAVDARRKEEVVDGRRYMVETKPDGRTVRNRIG